MPVDVDATAVRLAWRQDDMAGRLQRLTDWPAPLSLQHAVCDRSSRRRSLWKLGLRDGAGQRRSVVLKIHHRPERRRSRVEIGLYRHAYAQLNTLLPLRYALQDQGRAGVWLYMEHVPPIAGRMAFAPATFHRIIPHVAALHAATYREDAADLPRAYRDWLPAYASSAYRKQKAAHREKTLLFLSRGLQLEHLKPRLSHYVQPIQRLLGQAPLYVPVLKDEGAALVHGDLHTHNMCCHELDAHTWDLRFIDWESARFAPGWFELAVLVEILIDFRPDWRSVAADVRRDAVDHYVRELATHGIAPPAHPLRAYKAAYLERTLERGLYTQLRRELQGRRGQLLCRYLEKLVAWGKELGLL